MIIKSFENRAGQPEGLGTCAGKQRKHMFTTKPYHTGFDKK